MLDAVLSFMHEQRAVIHLGLHALVPFIIARCFAPKGGWQAVFMLMMATMLVDIDHLLATPIYAPNRCSILFHPLHQVWPMLIYSLMALWPVLLGAMRKQITSPERVMGWLGLGLLVHMVLDGLDCIWMKAI